MKRARRLKSARATSCVDGKDVTIIASGIMVAEALKAAQLLKNDRISARVVDMFTWKPIDTRARRKMRQRDESHRHGGKPQYFRRPRLGCLRSCR